MIKSLFFLAFIAFSAACITTQLTEKESLAARGIDYIDCSECDDENACTIDYCYGKDGSAECSYENVVCHSSERLCNDGYLASCNNFCDNGVCTTCEPQCPECKELTKQCPDGSIASCKEEYRNGICIACEPQCECTPKYSCSEWGDCINGFHTRICVDMNRCALDKKETKECAAIIKEEEQFEQLPQQTQQSPSQTNVQFIEIMYDPSGEESKEEYVVLSGNDDLSGWSISDNSGTWSLPQGTAINGQLIVARNAETFSSIYGCTALGGFTRGLNNDGDQLTLKDNNGNQKDFVAWEKGVNNAYPEWIISAKEGNVLRKNGEWKEASPNPC